MLPNELKYLLTSGKPYLLLQKNLWFETFFIVVLGSCGSSNCLNQSSVYSKKLASLVVLETHKLIVLETITR